MRREFRCIARVWALIALLSIVAPATADDVSVQDKLEARVLELYRTGKFSDAITLAEEMLRQDILLYGDDDTIVAGTLNILGALYWTTAKYEQAESTLKRSIKVFSKLKGPQDASLMSPLNNLAAVFLALGRDNEAETLVDRVTEIAEAKHLNAEPIVAHTLAKRSEILENRNDFSAAQKALEKSLEILGRGKGVTDPEFGQYQVNLGILLQKQGAFSAAEDALGKGLHALERSFGAQDHRVATAIAALGRFRMGQGRYVDAERLLRQALDIEEGSLGGKHPSTADSLTSLAVLYSLQNRYVEARPLFFRAFDITVERFGSRHDKTALALHNLASNSLDVDDLLDDALNYCRAALKILMHNHGALYPDVAKSMALCGQIHFKKGHLSEAEKAFESALFIRERIFGPDHPAEADALHSLALVKRDEADAILGRALKIREKHFGPNHPLVGKTLNNLAAAALSHEKFALAVDWWRRSVQVTKSRASRGFLMPRDTATAIEPMVLRSQFLGHIKSLWRVGPSGNLSGIDRFAEVFENAQWSLATEAAESLAQMSSRSAGGSPVLASLVRERQDLVGEWQAKDRLLIAAKSRAPAQRSAEGEKELSDRLAAIDSRLAAIDERLAMDLPDYAALASPKPTSVAETQAAMHDDEALILFLDTSARFKPLPEETFVWVVTKVDVKWVRSDLGTGALNREVAALRCGLDRSAWSADGLAACNKALGQPADFKLGDYDTLPFDAARAHKLYKSLFGEVEDLIRDKYLLVVPSGPLTQLPFQVLVTAPPQVDTPLADIAWLGARQPITVLPSVASLKALRDAKPSRAPEPFIGFGNPILIGTPECPFITVPDRCPNEPAPGKAPSQMIGRFVAGLQSVASYFIRGGEVNVDEVRKLCPLPDSAHELKCVAKSLDAGADNTVIGSAMTERALRQTKLDRYRVLHFATHGLLAGEMAELAKGRAEPALVFTPPDVATEEDDGLLTASEITTLKLDADWVVMSACNTAAGGAKGAEALSGLAKAFFYAGARALLVSHWPVNSYAATMLTSTTFAELKRDPKLGRAGAFRLAMVALINDKERPWAAHPSVWAPFVVVGEGGAGQ